MFVQGETNLTYDRYLYTVSRRESNRNLSSMQINGYNYILATAANQGFNLISSE